MNAMVYNSALELREESELRQKGWAGSLTLHALLLAFLILSPHLAPDEAPLTEFTWLETTGTVEEMVEAVAPPVKAAAEDPVIEEKPTPQPTSPARFERVEVAEAEVEPKPQSLSARDDRLSDRLSALRDNRPNIAVQTPQTTSLLKSPAADAPMATNPEKSELVRQAGVTQSSPTELRRDPNVRKAPRLATVQPVSSVRKTAIIPDDADLTVRRTLAGAALAGPAADRPVLEHVMPEFPDWAKREGVEGSVTLGFVVLPDGRVKANVMIHRTSGYQDFDRRAQDALRQWLFQPLPAGSTQEQWGTITMNFRLTN